MYSGNQISEKVKNYACQSTQNLMNSYSGLQLSLPFGATDIDLYDSKSEEILLFDDAIGVKRQKEFREIGYEKQLKRVQTDVIEVQRPTKDLPKDLPQYQASYCRHYRWRKGYTAPLMARLWQTSYHYLRLVSFE